MKKCFFIVALLAVFLFSKAQTASQVYYSPDGKIAFTANVKNDKLFYTVDYNKTHVIESSAMGLIINGYTFGEQLSIARVGQHKSNETYVCRGVHSKVVNSYIDGEISFRSYFPFKIEVRVFNDGVAFRYVVNSKGAAAVESDITEFNLPAGSLVWSQPNIKYYEGKYGNALIDTVKSGLQMGPPVTIELPENAGYEAITEGGLTDFSGMSLMANGNRILRANLSGKTKKYGNMESP